MSRYVGPVLFFLLAGCDPPAVPPDGVNGYQLSVTPPQAGADVGGSFMLNITSYCRLFSGGYLRTFINIDTGPPDLLEQWNFLDITGDSRTEDLSGPETCNGVELTSCEAYRFRAGDSGRADCTRPSTQAITFECLSMGSGELRFEATADDTIEESPEELVSGIVRIPVGCGVPPPTGYPNGELDVTGAFSGGTGGCGAPDSFTDSLNISVTDGVFTLTQPSTGDVNTGTIDSSGAFSAMRADGLESYVGMLANDGTGTAVNMYTADGCTSRWDVVFSLR